MADSNITKQALAKAMKELLEEQSFDKICVSDICEKCHMNRKSFYYHFRDKFDLVNWIFDIEFRALNQSGSDPFRQSGNNFDDRWKYVETICNYFYENRNFYKKVLKVDGQNSFSAHFREFIRPMLHLRIVELLGNEDVPPMVCDFVVDGILCSIERWLLEKECISVEAFMYNLKKLVKLLFLGLEQSVSADPRWLE